MMALSMTPRMSATFSALLAADYTSRTSYCGFPFTPATAANYQTTGISQPVGVGPGFLLPPLELLVENTLKRALVFVELLLPVLDQLQEIGRYVERIVVAMPRPADRKAVVEV